MWRFRARALLLSSSRERWSSPLQHQVLSKIPTLTLTPSPSLPSYERVFPTVTHLQLSRSFSVDPNASGIGSGGSDDDKNPSLVYAESRAPSVFEASELDGNEGLGENASSISNEADAWPTVFGEEIEKDDVFGGEDPDPFSAEAGDPSLVYDDGADKGEIDGESQDFSLRENGDGDDPVGALVSEESVGETADEVPEIDIEKLENVLSVLQSTMEEPLASRLDKMDLTLTEEFVTRVLQTPLVPGERLVGFFRWAWKKPEFVKTSNVVDLLVGAVSSSTELSKKEAYMLWDLVKEIGETENELLNTVILNQLVSLFWKLGKAKAGFEVFNQFEKFGCKLDANTYYLTIEALGKRSMFETAWSVCEKMLNSGSLPDTEKIGKLITFFCKGKKAKDAHLVYLIAKENEKYPPRSSVDFLIVGLSRNDDTVRVALELLEDYSGESRKYAIEPFTSVITGLCRIKAVGEAKKLLYRMIDSGPPPGNAVFNYVISALSKAGEMEDAIVLMKVMENRGLRPDIYSYNAIMSGFVKGGLMDEARQIFYEAKKRHSKLSRVTYHILIRGYCKIEEFENALKCMNEMKGDGIQPNTDEYNKMVQSLCLKAMDWRNAEKLLEEMKESGLYLKGITRSLIAAVKELEEDELQSAGAVEE